MIFGKHRVGSSPEYRVPGFLVTQYREFESLPLHHSAFQPLLLLAFFRFLILPRSDCAMVSWRGTSESAICACGDGSATPRSISRDRGDVGIGLG